MTTNSINIKIREDGVRAGEEITVYDYPHQTLYHTSYSRLSREELELMLKTAQKLDPKGKY
jgi:hypothetical protein